MMEELQAIVIDNGSFFCKAGFSNGNLPKNFVSIVGYKRYEGWKTKSDFYVGTEVYQCYSCFFVQISSDSRNNN